LLPSVDSIMGFAHAAGFAAARRCLRFLVLIRPTSITIVAKMTNKTVAVLVGHGRVKSPVSRKLSIAG